MNQAKDLADLVSRVKRAAGANLTAVVLYGSAANLEFHDVHSDLNTLCLLARIDEPSLAVLQPVSRWWWRKGNPAPLIFTVDELRSSADVFAIELIDMQRCHRMLLGDDFLSDFEVPINLHRLQVERELRTNLVRLRQAFLRSRGRRSELEQLMIDSVSSFAALFRHSLIAMGQPAPDSPRDAADRLAQVVGFDPAAFHTVLHLHTGKKVVNCRETFARYLDTVTRVADEIDRRFANT